MKFYKSPNNTVYAYESDGSQDRYIPSDQVPITAEEAEALSTAVPTQEEIAAAMSSHIQNHLDSVARSREYDSIVSLCSYATSTDLKYGPEGRAGVTWRDAVWTYASQVREDVLSGTRTVPAVDALIAELPAMEWPS